MPWKTPENKKPRAYRLGRFLYINWDKGYKSFTIWRFSFRYIK